VRNNHRAEHRIPINLVKRVLISKIERSVTRFDRKRNDMSDSGITRHPAQLVTIGRHRRIDKLAKMGMNIYDARHGHPFHYGGLNTQGQ